VFGGKWGVREKFNWIWEEGWRGEWTVGFLLNVRIDRLKPRV
jgi:hypothetical protein